MKYNRQLTERIAEVAEVAGYLWQKGWAERETAAIYYNVTDVADDALRALPHWQPLRWPVLYLHYRTFFNLIYLTVNDNRSEFF